ncbi:hypothetical protein TorRG33x02_192640 [Trema orientale]|uniref:Uncharacterized protein n=1 Tax=Trema orientale TaxID=63057 RepID=A0A2P5EHJ5_TREOI|nr:hypothetical protein TorRG33x02_192640 [Trema orientale]
MNVDKIARFGSEKWRLCAHFSALSGTTSGGKWQGAFVGDLERWWPELVAIGGTTWQLGRVDELWFLRKGQGLQLIWFDRNSALHGGVTRSLALNVSSASSFVLEFQNAMEVSPAVSNTIYLANVGGVFEDDLSRVVVAFSKRLVRSKTVNSLRLERVFVATHFGILISLVECDALKVVQGLSSLSPYQ